MPLKKLQVKEFSYTYGPVGRKEKHLEEVNAFLQTLYPYEIKTITDVYTGYGHSTRIYYLTSVEGD